ncbi:MAG: hypothetical protein C5B56_14770 [Proteobacteria bacterium]|nr:MAG: hypothetical protein C5B56_14770 [Pseudomonadota bacterium]
MRAGTALVASTAILAMLTVASTVASAQQVPRNAARDRQQYLPQPYPATPYYDDAARYRRIPRSAPTLPDYFPHKINPGGVGTDSPAQR